MSDISEDDNSLSEEFDSTGRPKEDTDPEAVNFTIKLSGHTAHLLNEWIKENTDEDGYVKSDILEMPMRMSMEAFIFESHMQSFLKGKLGSEEFEIRSAKYTERQKKLNADWARYEIQQEELGNDCE